MIGERYRILGEIGRGAFAAVHLAEDARTGERVAVKWMLVADDPTYHREIARLALLDGPGVARLRDHGRWDGREYLVLDYVEGEPFPTGPVPWDRLEPLAVSLLDALSRIHQRGVVHGDLRPENALVRHDRVTLLDFGTLDGVRHGLWVAPEVFAGAPSSAESDVFSAALMIAAASSGVPPWHDTTAAVDRASGRPPRFSVEGMPAAVGAAITAALTGRRPSLDQLAASFSALPDAPARHTPWTRDELEARFEGPEPIVHLRTRPAELLMSATDGRPDEVAALLARWERTGRITRLGDRFRASRPGLDEEEADREIAGIAGGDARPIWEAAERAIEQGRVHQGTFLLRAAALAARSSGDEALERLALETLAERAVYRGNLDVAEREIAASKLGHPDLGALLRALRFVTAGEPARALTEASLIPEPASPYVDAAVQACRFLASTRMGVEVMRFVSDEADVWAARRGTPYARARAEGWRGQLAYALGEFEKAAELHTRSLAGRVRASERLSAMVNAASGWVEAHAYERAVGEAEAAIALATAVGHRLYETMGRRIVRLARYRAAGGLAPDDELAAAGELIDPLSGATLLLVEAAGAWRRGDLHTATRLARAALPATVASQQHSAGLLVECLLAVCEAPPPDPEIDRLVRLIRAERVPAIALQSAALLAAAGVPRRTELRAILDGTTDDVRILDVLSSREARQILLDRWGFDSSG